MRKAGLEAEVVELVHRIEQINARKPATIGWTAVGPNPEKSARSST
jgi:hypothetical protein